MDSLRPDLKRKAFFPQQAPPKRSKRGHPPINIFQEEREAVPGKLPQPVKRYSRPPLPGWDTEIQATVSNLVSIIQDMPVAAKEKHPIFHALDRGGNLKASKNRFAISFNDVIHQATLKQIEMNFDLVESNIIAQLNLLNYLGYSIVKRSILYSKSQKPQAAGLQAYHMDFCYSAENPNPPLSILVPINKDALLHVAKKLQTVPNEKQEIPCHLVDRITIKRGTMLILHGYLFHRYQQKLVQVLTLIEGLVIMKITSGYTSILYTKMIHLPK